MEDLYMSGQLEDDAAMLASTSMKVRNPPTSQARFSLAHAERPHPSGSKSPKTMLARSSSRRSNRAASMWKNVRHVTDAAHALGLSGSSAALVGKLKNASDEVPRGQGIISKETSNSRVHTNNRCNIPWENEELLAKRGLRKDDILGRITSLDEKIRARKVESSSEQTHAERCSPPQHSVDWQKRPYTVATTGEAPQQQSHEGTDLQQLVPSDSELDRMDPVTAFGKLQDVEQQLLCEIQGTKSTVHDRIRCDAPHKIHHDHR